MSDRQMMRAVRAACEELVAELDALGWEFDHDEPLHPPGIVTQDHLDAMEHLAGPLPDVAVDFWLEVGGIDLSGEHPDWPDDLTPFVMEAPLDELIERVAREADGERPDRLPVSPDFTLRVAGGEAVTNDGRVVRLVDHLREQLLDNAGITGFRGERPEALADVSDGLPRF